MSDNAGTSYALSWSMKPSAKFLFVLTAVAALSVACPAKANLITNPGFETGDLTGWTSSMFLGSQTFNGQAPHSGNFQAVNNFEPASISQSVATTPGAAYMVSFFAAAPPIRPNVTMTVTFGATTIFSHLFNSITGYTEYTVNVTASSASSALNFNVDGSGFVLLDDISVGLARVGVPDGGTTVSLLGCALLGLAALRRRLGC